MGGKARMVGLALAMFIALFGWGANYFGWHDPVGKVQIAPRMKLVKRAS